jgi:hypothetical protein
VTGNGLRVRGSGSRGDDGTNLSVLFVACFFDRVNALSPTPAPIFTAPAPCMLDSFEEESLSYAGSLYDDSGVYTSSDGVWS